MLYGLESVPLTETRAKALDGCHRALARFALGIHYPETISNAHLRALGVGDASELVDERRATMLRRVDARSALSLIMPHPPTEMQRQGMSRLQTLRDHF